MDPMVSAPCSYSSCSSLFMSWTSASVILGCHRSVWQPTLFHPFKAHPFRCPHVHRIAKRCLKHDKNSLSSLVCNVKFLITATFKNERKILSSIVDADVGSLWSWPLHATTQDLDSLVPYALILSTNCERWRRRPSVSEGTHTLKHLSKGRIAISSSRNYW